MEKAENTEKIDKAAALWYNIAVNKKRGRVCEPRGGYNMKLLVTGAASGIGRAVCNRAAERGHEVYALDIVPMDGAEFSGCFRADITSSESLEAVFRELRERGTVLDAIITVAGIHAMSSLVEDDFSSIERLMDINLIGTMRTVKAFHPLLAERGRVIIVTSEVGTLDPLPFNGLYSVSKCALESYAQALRQELNLLGQKVVTIRPGAIETPLAGSSIDATERLAERTRLYSSQAARFSGIAKRFMGKPISPDRLARLIIRASEKKRPRLAYSKHRSAGLVLLNILPKRAQCAIIKLLLGVGKRNIGDSGENRT